MGRSGAARWPGSIGLLALCTLLAGCSGGDADDEGGADSGLGAGGDGSSSNDGSGGTGFPDGPGWANPIDSGLPTQSKLSELNAGEAKQLCSRIAQQTLSGLGDQLCTFSGLVSAGISYIFSQNIASARLECTESVNKCERCLSNPGPECESIDGDDTDENDLDTSECEAKISTCSGSVTVGETETCMGAQVRRLRSALEAAPSCQELTDEDLKGDGKDDPSLAEQTPECANILAECPGVVDD